MQDDAARRAAEDELISVAEMKVGQVQSWLKERHGDAAVIRSSTVVQRFLAAPEDANARGVADGYLGDVRRAYGYEAIAVFDSTGRMILSTDSNGLQRFACAAEHARAALRARDSIVTDLHRAPTNGPVHFSVLCPIRSREGSEDLADGVVLLIVDPLQFLYPLLKTEAVPSKTAETLLVRRAGGDVECVSEARHRRDAALDLLVPMSRTDAPEVKAVSGATGLLRGCDYRGVPVLAVARPVADTGWVLVAKQDEAEISAPSRRDFWMSASMLGFAALAVLMAILLRWRHQKLLYMRRELDERRRIESALQAREELFSSIVNQAVDAIALVDGATGGMIEFNTAAHEGLGYTREEFAGLSIAGIQADHSPDEIRRNFERIRAGEGLTFETKHRARDGRIRDVRVSARALRLQGRDCIAAVWSDITDRKAADAALRSSEEKYRGIFDESVAAIFVFDAEKRFVDANEAGLELLGYPREELLCLGIPDVDADPVVVLPAHQDLLAGGRLVNYEHRLRRKDGRVITVLNNSRALRDVAGNVIGMQSTLFDITERKETEARLRKVSEVQTSLHDPATLEQKLGMITDAVVDIFHADFARIWLVREADQCAGGCVHAAVAEGPHVCRNRDRCLHLVASSGRYTHLDGTGHRRVPLGCYKIGRVAAGLEPSFLTNDVTGDPRVHDHAWARELGLVSFAGYQLRPPHGDTLGVLALFSKHPLTSAEDALLRSLANMIMPVIQAAQAAEDIRQSRELLRLVLDTIPQAVFWKDRESRYLGCNKTFAALAGLPDPDRIVGMTDYELPWQKHETEAYRADDRVVIDSGEAKRHIIEAQLNADGVQTWIDTSKVPLEDSAGRAFGILGVYDDITARKQMEEDLRARNEELVRFSYTVSHDLKSPLVTIQTFLGYLAKDLARNDGERVKSDFGHIERAASKMLNLLDELLELSRVGRKTNPPEDVPFETLVRAALDAVAGQIAQRGVDIRLDAVPLVIRGDRPRLTEVFQNLIDNAVKFMGDQPAPRIEIGADLSGREPVFHVRDNGMGIDPRHQGKLFGLFEKLHPGTPGTGMGLALVKRIVELHGGRIWAESAGVSRGAAFMFTLRGVSRIQERDIHA